MTSHARGWTASTLFFSTFLTSACSSSSAPNSTAPQDAGQDAGRDAGEAGHPGDASAPHEAGADAAGACSPNAATSIDAGEPNIKKTGAGCVQDIACPTGQFCYVAGLQCTSPTAVSDSAGDGTGGHTTGGKACESALLLPSSCDDTSLDWSVSVDVSRSPQSIVESDTVLATDGQGTIVAAWSTIPDPATGPQQLNQLAVSHDDGASFTRLTTPIDAPTSATNDAVLSYDPSGVYYYVWEGYASDFMGAQHIWMSTSKTGDAWSAAVQVDAPGDFVTGGALDFPWIAVNPKSGLLYISYEAGPPSSNGSERLVIVGETLGDAGSDAGSDAGVDAGADGGSDAGGGGSLSLTDGTRPNAYADLARGVFDQSGNYYAAWMELDDSNTGIGGTLSGSTQNAIYFTRLDAGSPPVALAQNVKVSGASDAVNFDGPTIAVSPDGSALWVSYAVGTMDALDIVVATSLDRGQTWSPAVKVNDDAHCATHYHSSLVLDGAGRLYVFWYDNRDGHGHFFYAVSTDNGKTYSANRLVSAPEFPFDTFQYSTGWMGDYYEPAVSAHSLYVLWSDGREADQSHAFFAKAPLP
jgi:hypothetical protein